MKRTFLLAILIFPSLIQAQDWELFPKDQYSYFVSNSPNDSTLETIIMDSVRVVGSETEYYFRRNIPENHKGSCNANNAFWDFRKQYQNSFWPAPKLDKVVERNDSVFFDDLILIKNTNLGTSWYVRNDSVGVTYQIQYASTKLDTFLGVIDSVRVFSVTDSLTTLGITHELILSKGHGFVDYIPFEGFYRNQSLEQKSLIGINSVNTQLGLVPKDIADYFSLSPGDILLYKANEYSLGPMSWYDYNEYYKDSITSVISSLDSIVYFVERTFRDRAGVVSSPYSAVHKYYKRSFFPFTNGTEYFLSLGDFDGPLSVNHFYNEAIWLSNEQTLLLNRNPSQGVIKKSFSNILLSLDQSTCSIFMGVDYDEGFELNSWQGFTRFSWTGGPDPSGGSLTLVGSRISGVEWGNLGIPLSISDPDLISKIEISPNPASDRLKISGYSTLISSAEASTEVLIYNSLGKEFEVQYSQEDEDVIVNTSKLTPGLYFLRISIGEEEIIEKVLIK